MLQCVYVKTVWVWGGGGIYTRAAAVLQVFLTSSRIVALITNPSVSCPLSEKNSLCVSLITSHHITLLLNQMSQTFSTSLRTCSSNQTDFSVFTGTGLSTITSHKAPGHFQLKDSRYSVWTVISAAQLAPSYLLLQQQKEA